MWNVMKGSGHEKTDCDNSRLFHRTYDSMWGIAGLDFKFALLI